MNPGLAAVAVVIVGGAVVAVSAREAKAALLGLAAALIAASLLADPLPSPLAVAARLVGALLAVYLVLTSIRGGDVRTDGSRLGWPVELLFAAAAATIGFATHGLGAPALGPPEAQAAGFAVGVLAAVPIVTGRDVLRIGIGSMLLVLGALLVRVGFGGTPSELEQLVTAGLIVGLGGAIDVVVSGARVAVSGLEVRDYEAGYGRGGRPRLPAAHRLAPAGGMEPLVPVAAAAAGAAPVVEPALPVEVPAVEVPAVETPPAAVSPDASSAQNVSPVEPAPAEAAAEPTSEPPVDEPPLDQPPPTKPRSRPRRPGRKS